MIPSGTRTITGKKTTLLIPALVPDMAAGAAGKLVAFTFDGTTARSYMDDVRIYDIVLTNAEIVALTGR